MKIFLLFVLNLLSFSIWSQGSMNMSLLDLEYQDSLICNSSLSRYSDCYGFTWKNEEYAVIGSTEGTHIYHISAENELVPKGFIPGRYIHTSVNHRDYATYRHYLYAVCDEGVSDLQIIDFQYLPDSVHLVKEDSIQFGRVHNIFIDTTEQKFYSLIHRSTVNTQTIEKPMKIFSLADPLNLVELWSGPNDVAEVHDAYVKDGLAFLNCGYDGLRIYDFTNITSPTYLESLTFYQDQGYNHQGWLTPDGTTYLFADETAGKRVKRCSWNGTNLSISSYFGTGFLDGSVPHNIMANDTFCFVAYYNLGLHIYDLRYPQPLEVAYYDTYPTTSFFPMNGNWGVYTLLPSKRILAADRQYGLFLLGFDESVLSSGIGEGVTLFPNPSGETPTTIRFPNNSSEISYSVYDLSGNVVQEVVLSNFTYQQLPGFLAAGSYIVRGKYVSENSEKQFSLKWVNAGNQ